MITINAPPAHLSLAAQHSEAISRQIVFPLAPIYPMPILNNWGIVVGSATTKPLSPQLISEIETRYAFTKVAEIQELMDFITVKYGFSKQIYPLRLTATGVCNPAAKASGMCRPMFQAKDTCAGCGKSWLAGSYYQPQRCVPQKPTEWQLRHAVRIADLIRKNGGVSNVAPLVTTEGGKAARIIPVKKRA